MVHAVRSLRRFNNMNKFTIPVILAATIMLAGIFAFSPVEQASTVHDTIVADLQGAGGLDLDAIDLAIDDLTTDVDDLTTDVTDVAADVNRLDVTVFASGPAPTPTLPADIELIASLGVVDSGTGLGLIEIDILVIGPDGSGVEGLVVGDFTFTFTARDGGDDITEIGGDFFDVGDGLYTISADADTDFGVDGATLAYMITVVVDDVDDVITDAVGTGAASMTVIVTA